jgi:hypothetical protein
LTDVSIQIRELQTESERVQQKLHRLSQAYLDDHFSTEEYLDLKNPLMLKQQSIQQSVAEIKAQPSGKLELAEIFIRGCVQALFVSQSDDLHAQCQFLRKVASNRFLRDRKLVVSPLGAWKTVALYGPNGEYVSEPYRVSGSIHENILKGEPTVWLFDNVLEQTPIPSTALSDTTPPHTPPIARRGLRPNYRSMKRHVRGDVTPTY